MHTVGKLLRATVSKEIKILDRSLNCEYHKTVIRWWFWLLCNISYDSSEKFMSIFIRKKTCSLKKQDSVVGPFLAHLVGFSFLGPRFISLSCFSRCGSLPRLLRRVADKCICCSQRREFYLCVCASDVTVWIVWIPDRQRRYHHARDLAVCSVQDSHFTSEKRWSKTYCSFTAAVEQYRRESSAVLTRRNFRLVAESAAPDWLTIASMLLHLLLLFYLLF